jgi:hypothetical protein
MLLTSKKNPQEIKTARTKVVGTPRIAGSALYPGIANNTANAAG